MDDGLAEGEARHRSLAGVQRLLRSSDVTGWLLCLPALLVLVVFFLGPAIVGLRVSLFKWDGVSPTMEFVGLSNYAEALSSERFWNSMKVNWLAFFGSLLTQMPLALALALGLSRKGFGMKAYRSAIFAPQVMSIAAVALLWSLLYNPYQGPINQLFRSIGLDALATGWLGNPDTALGSLLVATAWFYFGFHMIIFMAGLAAIPKEIFEAAQLETSSWLKTLVYITLPLLREQMLLVFVFIFAGSFGHLMGFFSLMTEGGPAGATELLGIYMSLQAFRANRYGYASAISVIILLIVGGSLTWPALRVARERLEY